MLHNFRKSLFHERELAKFADKFYLDVLKASDVSRFSGDSESDMDMQRQDVDLMLKLNDINYRISEKFRDKDFGDLYIEIYSKYPHRAGWLQTGSPNAILYFCPKKVYWITHKSLKDFCLNHLFPKIPDKWFEELFQSHKTISRKCINIDKRIFNINIIQAHNKDGAAWETIGVSVPYYILESFGVKIMKFEYNIFLIKFTY